MSDFGFSTSALRRCVLLSAVFLSVLCSPTVSAQSIDSVFVAVPERLLPLLDRNARLDLLDYADAGMEAKVTNRLNGTTQLTGKSDTLVTLRLTPASQWSLRLVTDADGAVTYVVRQTYFLPEAYCREVRYDADWHALPE